MLGLVGILSIIFCYCLLVYMKKDLLKSFEQKCYESIETREKEIEEKEKLNKGLRKLLF